MCSYYNIGYSYEGHKGIMNVNNTNNGILAYT
jgi:hypothetical protein